MADIEDGTGVYIDNDDFPQNVDMKNDLIKTYFESNDNLVKAVETYNNKRNESTRSTYFNKELAAAFGEVGEIREQLNLPEIMIDEPNFETGTNLVLRKVLADGNPDPNPIEFNGEWEFKDLSFGGTAVQTEDNRFMVNEDFGNFRNISTKGFEFGEMKKDIEAIAYDGFNIPKSRKKVYGSLEKNEANDILVAKNVIKGLQCMAVAGNNPKKIDSKVVDDARAKQVKKAVVDMGVKSKAIKSDDLTLARLALCFLPVYFCVRVVYKASLKKQTDSTLDIVYHDISFIGCPEINKTDGYVNFYKKFGEKITRYDSSGNKMQTSASGEKRRKLDDDEAALKKGAHFKSALQDWEEIAKTGYDTDEMGKKLMEKVLVDYKASEESITRDYMARTALTMVKLSNRE